MGGGARSRNSPRVSCEPALSSANRALSQPAAGVRPVIEANPWNKVFRMILQGSDLITFEPEYGLHELFARTLAEYEGPIDRGELLRLGSALLAGPGATQEVLAQAHRRALGVLAAVIALAGCLQAMVDGVPDF